MNVLIKKGIPSGVISAPSSKSYSHRYLIASMLSNFKCKIANLQFSEDIKATIKCMKAFGCNLTLNEDSITTLNTNNYIEDPIFDCNESGSTFRFFIPLALLKYEKATFIGSSKLLERSASLYEEIFKELNISFISTENSLIVKGKLTSGNFYIRGDISSQYITGLLYSLPLLDGDSNIIITTELLSKSYVDLTLDVLKKFNIIVEWKDNVIHIPGNQVYKPFDSKIEGDFSNSAFLDVYNYLGGAVTIKNLNENSLQGDMVYKQYFKLLNLQFCDIDISNCIDLGPILFAFAALKHGARFTGCRRLAIKESNRAITMCEQLKKVGVESKIVSDDEIIITKSNLYAPLSPFDSSNDHRIVMALAIFCVKFDIKINNAEAINKSFPSFFDDLGKLNIEVIYD